MFKRKIETKLTEWKESNSQKAFILCGARQTGKSYIIDMFCKKNFKNYLFVDFIANEDAKNIINNCHNLLDYNRALSAIFGEKLKKSDTVLFFDECQEVKEIITMVKYLVQNNNQKYIISGSLLGLTLRNITSIPIGYAEIHQLFPFDYEEYLWANSVSEELIIEAKKCFKSNQKIPDITHNLFLKYFKEYLLVGGMPVPIKTFLLTNNYETLSKEQSYINSLYEADFTKYEAINKKLLLKRLYRYIPSRLNSEYSRFTLSVLDKKLRYETIEESLDWLIMAGVSIQIPLVNNLIDGLKLHKQSLFKLYFSDIGLLMNMLGSFVRNKILSNDTNFNYGFIYENYVAQQLIVNDFIPYYYNQRKHGEIEFIVEAKEFGTILPIEVKSGKDIRTHKALDFVMETYKDISFSYVFSNDNLSVEDKIIYAPIYCVNFLVNK
ncbi:MAG: AAA family ATPase [Bacillales bacterium]|jgi:predicted AAA+ superfamily ATPase|nr:AAA family ATPase [Bacillales bacterium]